MLLSENINAFFEVVLHLLIYPLLLWRLYKRKQALLGSNLSGIVQMLDENIVLNGLHQHSPLIFSESLMPSKNPLLILLFLLK